MSRTVLSEVPALTFHKNEMTASRRGAPIEQLICDGKPCQWYTPDVIHCTNLGGHGNQVDWKCEADLPESLRLGRVEVSCEGWSGPGDSQIFKESCSLQYRLTHIPAKLRSSDNDHPGSHSRSAFSPENLASTLFDILCIGVLLFILWKLLRACFEGGSLGPDQGDSGRPGTGGSPGSELGSDEPPPPYSPSYSSLKPSSSDQQTGWRPEVSTGSLPSATGAQSLNQRSASHANSGVCQDSCAYDWERSRASTIDSRAPTSTRQSSDRGAGSSGLGSMRRSTGFGGSSVR